MSSSQKPNVVLIICDQLRADALSVNQEKHFTSTPTLDMMAQKGYNFENCYSPVPSCVPARAALLTGLDQESSGRVGYEDEVPWNFVNTLPKTFTNLGYQTECIGKMHVYPARNRLGFEHVVLNDGYMDVDRRYTKVYSSQFEYANDYLAFLKEKMGHDVDMIDEGIHCNSWEVKPWTLPESMHPTNWTVSESIKFLQRRDPTKPFFLKMSFDKPHAPLDPLKYYFDMYMNRLPKKLDLHVGNWEKYGEPVSSIYALKGKLKDDDERRMVAAYLGLVTHVDNQISRFLTAIKEFDLASNTIFWFVADHGDQLGEHYLLRKAYPYQGSIHIPCFIYDPGNLISGYQHKIKQLVKIQDVFPSLVDLATGKNIPTDGKSVKQLLFGNYAGWRTELHGEHNLKEDSNQYILTDEWKFIWYPIKDEYQLFNMKQDPNEMNNLVDDKAYLPVVKELQKKLVSYLKNREEGFVKDGKLTKVPLAAIKATLNKAYDPNLDKAKL